MIRLPSELNQAIERGGSVVVPSRQRAHAARLAHAAAQLDAGRKVWPTPDILPVEGWLMREVERYAAGAGTEVPRLLSPAEEWLLWRQCTAEATGDLELVNRTALAESLRRASALAAEFGIEVSGHAAAGTETALLASVQNAVDERCQSLGAATVASLVGRLATNRAGELPVIGSGFIKLPPRLQGLVTTVSTGARAIASRTSVVIAADESDEMARIALWCRKLIASDARARLLIMLPGSPGTRERLATLIRQTVSPSADGLGKATDSLVVIEGGAPLARVPAVAHALETLSWLSGAPGDFETVSAWLRSPFWHRPDASARARLDLWLREHERMRFNLQELGNALASVPAALAPAAREISAQIEKAVLHLGQGSASPRDWSERFRAALESAFQWPGDRARSSGEQQTVVRFRELLDEFGQLAAATRAITRESAIQWFTELASRTAYRPADDDAVVTISATLADPVVRYDAIWVAGLHAEAFPQPVQPDPFLPISNQLAAGVPAASAAGRLAEARALMEAWSAATDELVLSAPSRAEDLELLPSPLLEVETEVARRGAHLEHENPAASIWLPIRLHREGLLETIADGGSSWPIEKPLPSGTRSLELQNQCPFRAYAELRLGSTPLDGPEPGVGADVRGLLLHAAMQKLWQRLEDSRGLAALSDAQLAQVIARCVEEAATETLRRSRGRGRPKPPVPSDAQGDLFAQPRFSPAMSREIRRAIRLIASLCRLERERDPFRVEGTELDMTLQVVGAHMNLRIDRIDVLEYGGRAILDYKSGRRSTADWYGERPSHPQLLAYLAAVGEDVVAMCTVNVTAREIRFDGIAQTPDLLPKLRGVEGPYGRDPAVAWPLRREEWLARVDALASAFLAGHAHVDPKPGACDYCHVASICRIADRAEAAEVTEQAND